MPKEHSGVTDEENRSSCKLACVAEGKTIVVGAVSVATGRMAVLMGGPPDAMLKLVNMTEGMLTAGKLMLK